MSDPEREYVIILLSLTHPGDHLKTPHDGKFLAAYNASGRWTTPKGYPPEASLPQGEITSTGYESHAMTFESHEAAVEFWRQTVGDKLRPDGKPNRPLTAFDVEILSRVKVAHPEHFNRVLDDEEIERKCHVGEGARCCRFLGVVPGDGWSCLYVTPLRSSIEMRASKMNAKSGPCANPTDSHSEAVL